MATTANFKLPNIASALTLIQNALVIEGYSLVRTETISGYTYRAYRAKTPFVDIGSDPEAYFHVVLFDNGTSFGLTACRSAQGSFVGLIPATQAPTISALTLPFDLVITVTNTRAMVATKDSTNAYQAAVNVAVNWTVLDVFGLQSDSFHYYHVRNNNQCIFKVGELGSARLLYTGTIGSANTFNQLCNFDFLADNNSSKKSPQGSSIFIPTTPVHISNRMYGILDGVSFSSNSAIFQFDRCIDQFGKVHRYVRKTGTSRGVLVKETV